MAKLNDKRGYGQLELNQVAFRRDGRIEAQCKMADGIEYLENGMILAINPVTRTVGFPDENSKLFALHYSAEHMYDEKDRGLKHFKLEANTFLPRLGYLATGDKFTTNTVEDSGITLTTIATGALVYGEPSDNGYIKLTTTKPTGSVVLQAIEYTTMPDGAPAIKFIVL
jgi:hypothetical protein